MADFLEIPNEICKRSPTPDTYTMHHDSEEFYFGLPYEILDLCLYGRNNNISPTDVAKAVPLEIKQVQRVYQDIDKKRSATRYQHTPPLLLQKMNEISFHRDQENVFEVINNLRTNI